uniref:Uncharacterized protein n=1 Tax=viral metagenome TaxID=1070528 RepID=A0A6M3K967_9ZZZZ
MNNLTAALYHISALALLWMWIFRHTVNIQLSGFGVIAMVLIFLAIGFVLYTLPLGVKAKEVEIENAVSSITG